MARLQPQENMRLKKRKKKIEKGKGIRGDLCKQVSFHLSNKS